MVEELEKQSKLIAFLSTFHFHVMLGRGDHTEELVYVHREVPLILLKDFNYPFMEELFNPLQKGPRDGSVISFSTEGYL